MARHVPNRSRLGLDRHACCTWTGKCCCNDATANAAREASRHAKIMCENKPESPNCSAMQYPMPLFAPVTTATCPVLLLGTIVFAQHQITQNPILLEYNPCL
jgi:hypothetical protein